ncbi:MAG: hypothetical protein Q9222_002417 [Ikaeria aurantiellina]
MAASFDALLQADRQKRKNEALANALLGKGRRASTPSNGIRKSGPGASLASRIGASNRSLSAAAKPRSTPNGPSTTTSQPNSRMIPSQNPRPVRENPMVQRAQKARLQNNLARMDWESDANGQANIRDNGTEITIRGSAGPYTVVGSNFAPGTTAADIESAMLPIGGEMQDCRIFSKMPTVMAEMVFSEKATAENVIATFNNKRADGRLLSVYMKSSNPPMSPKKENRPAPPHNAPSEPKAARIDLTREQDSYAKDREQSDRNRRRADPEFQDGSFGFGSKEDRMEVDIDDRRDLYRDRPRQYGRGGDMGRPRDERRLYSDDMYPRPRGRGFQ